MTASSRERFENGIFSVMHSSISIANEYVSEQVVGRKWVSGWVTVKRFMSPRSSGAEYLTPSPDDTAFGPVLSVISSTIFAIPKSQISGSPLPACGQPVVPGSRCKSGIYLARDKYVFLPAFGQYVFTVGYEKLTHLTVEEVKSCIHVKCLPDSPPPCTTPCEWR